MNKYERKQKRENKVRFFSGVILVVMLAAFSWQTEWSSATVESSKVVVGIAQTEAIDKITSGFGTVDTKVKKTISSPQNAVVSEVFARNGDIVQEGDPILRLSSANIDGALRLAKSNQDNSSLTLREVESQAKLKKINLEKQVIQAEHNLKRATLYLEALDSLREKGIVSGLDYVNAQIDAEEKNDLLVFSKQQLETEFKVEEEKIAIARQRLSISQQHYGELLRQQKELFVKAPITGAVSNMVENEGVSVIIGDPLVTLSDLNSFYIQAKVPQSALSYINENDPVLISLNGKSIKGHVLRARNTIEKGNALLDINLIGDFSSLVYQQSIATTIFSRAYQNQLHIKSENGVSKIQAGQLFIEQDPGVYVRQTVNITKFSDTVAIVNNGLLSGDKVLLDYPQELKNEDTIRVVTN